MAGGRPSKWKDEFVDQTYRLCLLGCTEAEIAQFLGITDVTFALWKKRKPEFSGAIARGKHFADAKVAESLYHRALGYSHTAVKLFCHEGAVVEAPYTKQYPPDTQAASLWLRNRRSRDWQDKSATELTGPGGGPIQLLGLVERRISYAGDVGADNVRTIDGQVQTRPGHAAGLPPPAGTEEVQGG